MEAVYFTVVADFILDRAERMAGRRFDNRSLIFFGILMTLALVSFSLIRTYTG